MAGAAAFPIFMGIFVRMTMLEFLKENRDEKARRFFGLFFFVSLKVFTFKFDIRKVIPSFIGKRLPAPGSWLPKIGKKKSATVAVEGGEAVPEGGTPPEGEVAAEGAAEGAAAAEGDIEAPAATADNSEDATADAEDEEESEDSDADVSSEEEFEVAENEVAWNCRVCNEFNLQEKIVQSKNMTKRRLGTKENAANVKMVVRTVGRIHEHYVVEFKQLKNTNHCRKCWTAHDYKPQHCNAHSFFGLQDYKDQLHEPAAHVEGVNANTFEGDYGTSADGAAAGEAPAAGPPSPTNRRGSTGGRDSVLMYEHQDLSAGLRAKDLSLLDKISLIKMKFGNSVHAFLDPEPTENQVLYNDHTFSRELKKFMPFVDRKELAKGEKYKIGDLVEAIERQTVWYPGVVKRAGANGTCDVIYDNGDTVETVLPVKIRYRQTYKLSRLARFTLLNFLIASVVGPLPAWLLYMATEPNLDNPIPDSSYTITVAPLAVYSSLGFIAVLFSFGNTFLKTAQAGVRKHLRLMSYFSLPYASAFAFIYLVNEKMSGNEKIMWYHASIAIFITALLSTVQWGQINHFYGKICWFLLVPFTLFAAAFAITLDEIITVPSQHIVYAPLNIFSFMLICARIVIPYVRTADF